MTVVSIRNPKPEEAGTKEASFATTEHSGSGFCYNPTCSCKTNQQTIRILLGHVLRGTASVEDMNNIYRGRNI